MNKQLFDIGHLFDRVDSLEVLAKSFEAFVNEEAGYRGLSIGTNEVLSDKFEGLISELVAAIDNVLKSDTTIDRNQRQSIADGKKIRTINRRSFGYALKTFFRNRG